MEELVITIVVIVLVVYLIIGALSAIAYWGGAALFALCCGFAVATVRALMLRRPRALCRVASASWNGNDASLYWSIDERALERQSWAVAIAILAAAAGLIVLWQGFGAFVSGPTPHQYAARSGGDPDTFFRIVGGVVMGAAGLIGAGALTHKAATKICRASVLGVVRHLERASVGLDALGDAEANIRNVAQEIGVDWPEGLTENVAAFLNGQCDSLLLHAKAFRRHVASALHQAEQDLARLSQARDSVRRLRMRFRDASAAANQADAITLIHELEAMHEAMTSESMMSLLIERRWDEFAAITKDMHADLTRIEQQAQRFERGHQPTCEAASESEFSKACRILGCDENITPTELKQRYRELANSFHPDKSSQATPAVRALAEERFKEIQQAWETIKAVNAA